MKARLLQSRLVAVPIAAALTAISTITVPQITLTPLLINTLLGSLRTLTSMALVLGLALINPIFAEESRERNLGIINLMVVIFATIGLEIGSTRLGLSFGKILPDLDLFTVLLCDHLFADRISFVDRNFPSLCRNKKTKQNRIGAVGKK